MKKIIYFICIVMVACNNGKQKLTYPETRKDNIVDNYFGVEVADPYRWLENDTSQEVKKWVEAQNKLTFEYLSKIPYRENLKKRLADLINYEKRSVPFKKGKNYFYFKNEGLQNQSVLYVTDDINKPGKVLMDPNTLSNDGTIALGTIKISPDGNILAYAISKAGSDWNTVCFLDINSGKPLTDTLQWVKFSGIAWFNDGVYYSGYDEPKKGKEFTQSNQYHKLFYHKLGTQQKNDVVVLENPNDPLMNFFASSTSDDAILCIYEEKASKLGNALRIIDFRETKPILKTVVSSFEFQYSVIDHKNNCLYIKTNEGANNYKIIKIQLNNLNKQETIIPETSDVIDDAIIVGDKIVVNYLHDASNTLKVFSLEGKYEYTIQLPGIGSVSGLDASLSDSVFFFSFSSFNYPTTVFYYNVLTKTMSIWYKPQIDFDDSKYIVNQIFYQSKDGTRVPMFIVHKKDIPMKGKNPTLLYGYGGFNISLTPSFSATRLLWLEQGGILAIANLRGGGEYGEKWHLAGTKLNKQNVFDDFIAAAEYLINNKYTSPDLLAIQGGSNGGLLVGAVTNQRPELFKVALPAVGVMDMLRFHKFTIGWSWVTDYGSSENEEEFKALYAYSPIHNIKENTNYPAILVTTADHDDRVVPAHSFKYIATLQEKCKGPNPVLIRIETQAGHGGGKPISKIIEETADIYAFTFYNMGITPKF